MRPPRRPPPKKAIWEGIPVDRQGAIGESVRVKSPSKNSCQTIPSPYSPCEGKLRRLPSFGISAAVKKCAISPA